MTVCIHNICLIKNGAGKQTSMEMKPQMENPSRILCLGSPPSLQLDVKLAASCLVRPFVTGGKRSCFVVAQCHGSQFLSNGLVPQALLTTYELIGCVGELSVSSDCRHHHKFNTTARPDSLPIKVSFDPGTKNTCSLGNSNCWCPCL